MMYTNVLFSCIFFDISLGISVFRFWVTWGLSGPPESIPTMPPARAPGAKRRRTLSRSCWPIPALTLAPRADKMDEPEIAKFSIFQENHVFSRNSSLFKEFAFWAGSSSLSTRGVGGVPASACTGTGLGDCPTALRACQGHHRNRFRWSGDFPSDPKTKFRDFL